MVKTLSAELMIKKKTPDNYFGLTLVQIQGRYAILLIGQLQWQYKILVRHYF